ncbi:MAG: universal stress protein [Saprospiraceae bacterium]|nr:universal stress protein [Saprospiraceae bacterium]
MANFPVILTALDLTEMDEKLMSYSHLFANQFGTKKVYFTHIVPDFSSPDNKILDFHKKFAPDQPLDEVVKAKIKEGVDEHFGKMTDIEIGIDTLEGRPYHQLVHWVGVKDPDLVVVGKKTESTGSGITAKRLARNLKKASVLFVTDTAKVEIKEVVVPVDYSENSARALSTALDMQLKHPDMKVKALYVIDYPPTGFYLNREEYQGFNKMLQETAETSFQEFLQTNNLPKKGFDFEIVENSWHNISGAIVEYLEKNKPDLCVVGAQGHSAFESFLFGSVTENLVSHIKNTPLLVVR